MSNAQHVCFGEKGAGAESTWYVLVNPEGSTRDIQVSDLGDMLEE
jgi:hypothetical protein